MVNTIPYALRDGIRRYGQWSLVTEQDITTFRRTPESYLHIVRHMRSLSPEATQHALSFVFSEDGKKQQVTLNYINDLLATAGSKFHKKITDPLTIIAFAEEHVQEKVKLREQLYWHETPDGEYICHLTTHIEPHDKAYFTLNKQDSLGTYSIMEINEENQALVTRKMRGAGEKIDRIEVNMIKGEAPPSDNLIIILHKPDQHTPATVYTAYTGILAPPLPHASQSEEEFAYNVEWWRHNAFVMDPR